MDDLEEIKAKIDLVQFISETVPLKKSGRNFKGLCPFHIEKTPSFMVSPERQIWKCFGCQKSGDVFTFLMEMERIEFGEALRILAKKTGVVLQGYRPTQSEAEKDKFYQINHLASEFFHYLLVSHPIGKRALDYILQRGISKDSLALFKIGYSTPGWDGLQKYMIGKKGYKADDLEKAGLIIASSKFQVPSSRFYDRFRDRLMFPLYDHRGNVVGFAGRVLPEVKEARLPSPAAQAAGGQAKYVNSPETLIYHKSELLYPLNITKEDIKRENTAMVVEGELDAISSFQAGIKNVVAIKGSALTEEQSRLLKRFAENIILSLDSDSAGDMASRRGVEIAEKTGLNIKILTLEKYKDPDETAQKEPDYLKERYQGAVNIYDFFIDSAFKRFRGKTPEEKKKIGQEIVPIISKIEDEIVKNFYAKKFAEKLGVNEESVILQMEKIKSKVMIQADNPVVVQQKERKGLIEEYLLSIIFQGKITDYLLNPEISEQFTQPIHKRLIEYFIKFMGEKGKFSSQFFYNYLPVELRETYDKLYLIDFGNQLENSDWVKKELKKTQTQLKIALTKEELNTALQRLRREETNQSEEFFSVQAQVKVLAQMLGELEKSI